MAKNNKKKSHQASKKRFKVTGTGKVLHNQQGNNHLRLGKARNRKARLSGKTDIGSKNQAKKIKSLI